MAQVKTAREQLTAWDAGESVWSISMGGFGPSYEQPIQILAIEIVRDEIDNPLPVEKFGDWGDATVSRIDYELPDGRFAMGGFSGAQVGVAKSLAWHWINEGPEALLRSAPNDRHIQVSAFFPQAPKAK